MRLAVLLCVAALFSPGAIRAATASFEPSKGLFTYAADPGEKNQVDASVVGDLLTLQDSGASITAGVGCTSVDAHEVTCPFPDGVNEGLNVYLHDEPDTLTVDSTHSGFTWVVSGGGGEDTLIALCQDICAHLGGGSGADLLEGQSLGGEEGDDTLTGTSRSDFIDGGDGDDTSTGAGGDDSLSGGRGDDTLKGGPGADLIHGGSGKDALDGGRGADFIDGGFGTDTLSGGLGTGRDFLIGHWGEDHLDGGDGNDRLRGGPQSDLLLGRAGDDRIDAKDGYADHLQGGPGADKAEVDPKLDVWTSVQTLP